MSEPSRTTGTSTMVDLPSGDQFLLVDIAIDCPVCGQHTVRFAGHHLRAIRNFLTATIDEYPDLTLKDGDVHTLERLEFRGPANDPRSS